MSDRRFVLLATCAALTACENGIPLQSVPAETADVFCGAVEACLGRLGERTGAVDSCQAVFEQGAASRTLPVWEEIVARGTATYNPGAAATCLEETRAQGCDLLNAAPPASCREVWTGTIELGGACSVSEECAGDAYCANASCPDVRGTCTARVGSGGACESDDHCQSGLVCNRGTCAAPPSTSGGPCQGSTGLICPLDEICIGAEGETAGTCTPISEVFSRGEGEPCDLAAEDYCAFDLSCAVMPASGAGIPDMTCVRIASSGGACTLAFPDMCPRGEYCAGLDLAMGDFEGTCEPLPGPGQACATGTIGSPSCASGLDCVGGTCIARRANGETCTSDQECRSGFCDGSCGPPPLCD